MLVEVVDAPFEVADAACLLGVDGVGGGLPERDLMFGNGLLAHETRRSSIVEPASAVRFPTPLFCDHWNASVPAVPLVARNPRIDRTSTTVRPVSAVTL